MNTQDNEFLYLLGSVIACDYNLLDFDLGSHFRFVRSCSGLHFSEIELFDGFLRLASCGRSEIFFKFVKDVEGRDELNLSLSNLVFSGLHLANALECRSFGFKYTIATPSSPVEQNLICYYSSLRKNGSRWGIRDLLAQVQFQCSDALVAEVGALDFFQGCGILFKPLPAELRLYGTYKDSHSYEGVSFDMTGKESSRKSYLEIGKSNFMQRELLPWLSARLKELREGQQVCLFAGPICHQKVCPSVTVESD